MTIEPSTTTKYFFLDGTKIFDKESFFNAISIAMDFPSCFKHNWDAFCDCLNDLSWVKEDCKILIWVDPPSPLNQFQLKNPRDYWTSRKLIKDITSSNKLKLFRINESSTIAVASE